MQNAVIEASATVVDATPGLVAAAQEAVKTALKANPAATLVIAGVVAGAGGLFLVTRYGPRAFRSLRSGAVNATAWAARKMGPAEDMPALPSVDTVAAQAA